MVMTVAEKVRDKIEKRFQLDDNEKSFLRGFLLTEAIKETEAIVRVKTLEWLEEYCEKNGSDFYGEDDKDGWYVHIGNLLSAMKKEANKCMKKF